MRFGNSKDRRRSSSWAQIHLEHFWNDFAADRDKSVSERDRRIYAMAYAQRGAMQADFEVFQNFERDATDFAKLRQDEANDADAGAVGRERQRAIPDRFQGRVSCLP
jgi:hypothetical protein